METAHQTVGLTIGSLSEELRLRVPTSSRAQGAPLVRLSYMSTSSRRSRRSRRRHRPLLAGSLSWFIAHELATVSIWNVTRTK
jgi:hypothetical protein